MNKTTKIIITVAIVAVIAVLAGVLIVTNSKPKSKLAQITSSEDVEKLINGVYEGINDAEMYSGLQTTSFELDNTTSIKYLTGLTNMDNLEYISMSQPLINIKPYSFIVVKVKDGKNVEEVAQELFNNVNPRRWICVTAEETFVTSSGNVVMCVMGNEEIAKPVYEEFKKQAGTVGKEYHQVNVSEDDYLDDWPDELLPDDTDDLAVLDDAGTLDVEYVGE